MMAGATESRSSETAPPGRSSFWRTFESLRERDYAWYFVGNTAFFMGMQMNVVIRGFLAYELTDSATALGLVSFGFAIPMLFVAPFAGVVSDRVNKRNLLMVAQSATGLVNLGMAILVLSGMIAFWHLMVSSVLTGACWPSAAAWGAGPGHRPRRRRRRCRRTTSATRSPRPATSPGPTRRWSDEISRCRST